MKGIANGFLLLVLLLLIAPWLQKQTRVFNSPDLKGAFISAEEPVFVDSAWFDGYFQERITKSVNDRVGFRSDFVRLYNQLDYSFFRLSHAYGIIVGKRDYLYFEEGIHNLTGKYRLEPEFYRARVKEYRMMKEYLMKKSGIPLLLVIAPDKAHFYPEYIPDRYLKIWETPTKYQALLHELNDANVDYIDFNGYFMKMKDTARYCLYPRSGSHWGSYGAMLAFDSLTRYLERKHGFSLPDRVVDSMVITREVLEGDGDMTQSMNLAMEPAHVEMALPRYHFSNHGSTDSLKVLFVGDSFFWKWYDQGAIGHTFSNWQFWYYNQGIYPESFSSYKNAYTLNFMDALSSFDAIVLMQTMGGEGKIGFGFLERGYCEMMSPGRVDEVMAQIRQSDTWMEAVNQKAASHGLPLETVLTREAIYCIYVNDLKENY